MLVMNPGFFVPVCLLVAKVQKFFQITDGYARFLIRRHKNKGWEAEAEDVGTAPRPFLRIANHDHTVILFPLPIHVYKTNLFVHCTYYHLECLQSYIHKTLSESFHLPHNQHTCNGGSF